MSIAGQVAFYGCFSRKRFLNFHQGCMLAEDVFRDINSLVSLSIGLTAFSQHNNTSIAVKYF